jgi:hypothetical protein
VSEKITPETKENFMKIAQWVVLVIGCGVVLLVVILAG